MFSKNNQEKQIFFELLRNNQVTLQTWIEFVPFFDSNDFENLFVLLIKLLETNLLPYIDFLKQLFFYSTNEDHLTEILEILFECKPDITSKWFNLFTIDFLIWNTSDIILENFFIFFSSYYKRNTFDLAKCYFIQELLTSSYLKIKFFLTGFLIEQNKLDFDFQEILQLFYSLNLEFKLRFLPILLYLPITQQINFLKIVLFDNNGETDDSITLAIIFQNKNNLEKIFTDFELFLNFIRNQKEKKFFELLFLEFTKDEWISNIWIQKLLFYFLEQNTGISSFIIEASGEFLSEWPENFRKEYLNLILNSYNNLKVSLAKVISPLWIDESVIMKLLKNENKTVQETLYESLITIYQLLSLKLQKFILNLFSEGQQYQKYLGLLIGYNFEIDNFKKIIIEQINDPIKIDQENYFGGMLLGLAMKWNNLKEEIKNILKIKLKYLSTKLKEEFIHGLDITYGSLNVDGINLALDLQSYSLESSNDDINLL
jgi:hypothetical protein